ncbi:hypothetical protein SLE2022_121880 [Rubroshorea leprosula]
MAYGGGFVRRSWLMGRRRKMNTPARKNRRFDLGRQPNSKAQNPYYDAIGLMCRADEGRAPCREPTG